jgi:hypothetical protein
MATLLRRVSAVVARYGVLAHGGDQAAADVFALRALADACRCLTPDVAEQATRLIRRHNAGAGWLDEEGEAAVATLLRLLAAATPEAPHAD